MKDLHLEKTIKTPYIHFNAINGHLVIEGRSIPEDAYSFYTPVYRWLERFNQECKEDTLVEFKLEYFNTSSSKCILEILKILEKRKVSKVDIKWFYEEDDEDMLDSGKDYKHLLSLPIQFETY